ncbi:MAG: VOC family protein [Planctomycetota bacterium]
MVKNPPDGYQRIIPYLVYADAPAAIDFLTKAFGFRERLRLPGEDGRVGHAELELGGNVVMLASVYEELGHGDPLTLGARCVTVLCYVDDVDAHYAAACAAGAQPQDEPKDQFYGDRSYRVLDPGGHQWFFAQHIRDVPPEELAAGAG